MKPQQTQSESMAQRVLDRIKAEKIQPTSSVRFVAKDVLFWVLWGLSVVIGAVTIAASLFVLEQSRWNLHPATHSSAFNFVVDSLPYFWILALILFTVVAYENLRQTRHGYRFSLPLILAASLPASLLLGGVLYHVGMGEVVETRIGERLPFHRSVVAQQQALWLNPAEGRLAGRVDAVNLSSQEFSITSFDGRVWNLSSEALLQPDIRVLEQFPVVRVVGVYAQDTGEFRACFVLPWNPEGRRSASDALVWCDEVCERNLPKERSIECKGLRPYEQLERLQRTPYPSTRSYERNSY